MPFSSHLVGVRSPHPSPARSLVSLTVIAALLLGACGGEDSATDDATPTSADSQPTVEPDPTEPVPSATPAEAASPTVADPTPTVAPTTTTEPGIQNVDEEALFPVDLGYPEIGTIIDLQVGDISCYATVVDNRAATSTVGATFELCDRADQLIGTNARLIYSIESVADCESSDPCGQSRDDFLISDAVDLGDSWQVLANEDWIVTVGRLETWNGVNNTGELTYYACDASPSPIVPGLNDPQAGCLALAGGTVDCNDGTCATGWQNGDLTHVLLSPIDETDQPGASTLQVRDAGTVILDSPGLVVVDSSDATPPPIAIEFDPGAFETVVSGAAVRGERIVYSVGAAAEQTMIVSITSLEDNAVFDLYSPAGSALAIEAMEVEISPTESGAYQLVVGGTRGNATYDLAVSIR